MHLPLKTILLGAAVASAIPVAITPQQHHDATELKHKIQDHGDVDECGIENYLNCVKAGRLDCQTVSSECKPDGATAISDDVPSAGSNQVGSLGLETLVATPTPNCMMDCLRGPAEGPEENRQRADCVRRCREWEELLEEDDKGPFLM